MNSNMWYRDHNTFCFYPYIQPLAYYFELPFSGLGILLLSMALTSKLSHSPLPMRLYPQATFHATQRKWTEVQLKDLLFGRISLHFCHLGLFILSKAYGATAVHFLPVPSPHTIHKPSSGSLSFAQFLELMTKDPFKKKRRNHFYTQAAVFQGPSSQRSCLSFGWWVLGLRTGMNLGTERRTETFHKGTWSQTSAHSFFISSFYVLGSSLIVGSSFLPLELCSMSLRNKFLKVISTQLLSPQLPFQVLPI